MPGAAWRMLVVFCPTGEADRGSIPVCRPKRRPGLSRVKIPRPAIKAASSRRIEPSLSSRAFGALASRRASPRADIHASHSNPHRIMLGRIHEVAKERCGTRSVMNNEQTTPLLDEGKGSNWPFKTGPQLTQTFPSVLLEKGKSPEHGQECLCHALSRGCRRE